MKAILGVDAAETYIAAKQLLMRLQIPNLQLKLVHAVEPFTTFIPPIGGVVDYIPYGELLKSARETAHKVLNKAQEELCAQDVSCETAVHDGFSSHILIEEATKENADLIAVGATGKGRLGALFMGSVTRALAISSKQSILVAKGDPKPEGALTAIFATDHSRYADASLEKLISWKLKGLQNITVLTAYDNWSVSDPDAQKAELEQKSKKLVDQLSNAGFSAGYRLVEGYADEVIHSEMEASHTDLLIIGAQGHGFLERFAMGSTALHQVMFEPYSVLVLRN